MFEVAYLFSWCMLQLWYGCEMNQGLHIAVYESQTEQPRCWLSTFQNGYRYPRYSIEKCTLVLACRALFLMFLSSAASVSDCK